MENPFRDPIWQFWGTIIGLISLAITIIIAVIRRQKRELSYKIISTIPLTKKIENTDERLSIIFNKQRVSDVVIHIIYFRNSGNQPIKMDDYERPISIKVKKPTKILIAEIINTKPSSLSRDIISFLGIDYKMKLIALNQRGNIDTIMVKPILLNPNDEFTIKLIYSNFIDGNITIDSRIIGISDIKLIQEGPIDYIKTLIWIPFIAVVSILFSLLQSDNEILKAIGFILMLSLLIWILFDTVDEVRTIWKKISKKK